MREQGQRRSSWVRSSRKWAVPAESPAVTALAETSGPPSRTPLGQKEQRLLAQLVAVRRLLAAAPWIKFTAAPLVSGTVLIALEAVDPITVEGIALLQGLAEQGLIELGLRHDGSYVFDVTPSGIAAYEQLARRHDTDMTE